MFDLVTGKARRLPSHSTLPIMLSTTTQAFAAAAALVMPTLFVAERIPEIPTMLAFVAPLLPPPAPPPPPAKRSAPVKPSAQRQPVPSTREVVAPAEVPKAIEPEQTEPPAIEDGVPGGIEGGVPGGIIGGVVSGLPEPPPPPPPPAPPAGGPVRIIGDVQPPALLHRVEPIYPPAAVIARLQGLVILEALVDRDGTVAEVRVVRSAGSVLDREALIAVRQWRYAPFMQNGQRERFVLRVMLSFTVGS
jgi:periplasmic protein TonB